MNGDVFELRSPKRARGHEQQRGRRFGIVVQGARFEHMSPWLAIPTSVSAGPAVYRPEIVVPGHGPSRALCEGLSSIDSQERLGARLGSVTLAEMQQIDRALRLLMDLDQA